MSIACMAWALAQTGIDPSTKFVLMILADHANDDGVCWPGQKGIAVKVGTTDRQVRRHIAKLIESSLIKAARLTKEGGYLGGNRYTLCLPQMSCGQDASVLSDRTPVSYQEPSIEPSIQKTPIVPGAGDEREVLYSQDFEAFFWIPYPKKTGKGKAYEEWNKLKPSNGTREKIKSAVTAATKTAKWSEDSGRYIPNPATFLHQRRWEDEIGKAVNERPKLVF